ncbi:hypothetical protein C1H46_000056 [Malus baccata]|uniref:Uncharacterized protein n=1 Tax=Malus baccata TaxID=106549 RepID=A0A540NT07_MALBA|nr:hypothetical protein C1H46_000056 [Malus baccata]
MVDSGGPSSKRVQGEGSKKAMQNNCPTAEWRSWNFVPEDVKKAVMNQLLCNYTLDDTNEELMKLMDEALKRGYRQWRYDVERNGGPAE